MKSITNPAKLLSIWERYWGELSPNWAESFLADTRINSILNFDDLMILQAVQKHRKVDDILKALEDSLTSDTKILDGLDNPSGIGSENQNSVGTNSEIAEILEWLEEFTPSKLIQEEVVNWTTARTDFDTCKDKRTYESEKDAILTIIRLGKRKGEVVKQLPYKCNVCRKFHNTHTLSWESIERLQRKFKQN